MDKDTQNLLIRLALYVGVGYVAYRFVVKPFLDRIPKAQDVSRATSEAAHLLTTSTPTVKGQIRLTDGTMIAINDLVRGGGSVDAAGNFAWQGQRYTILNLGPDGVYEVM